MSYDIKRKEFIVYDLYVFILFIIFLGFFLLVEEKMDVDVRFVYVGNVSIFCIRFCFYFIKL